MLILYETTKQLKLIDATEIIYHKEENSIEMRTVTKSYKIPNVTDKQARNMINNYLKSGTGYNFLSMMRDKIPIDYEKEI